MKILATVIIGLISFQFVIAQDLTGNALLEKAIKYHDPNQNWSTFNGELFVTMSTPNNSNRDSHIIINLQKEFFQVKATRDSVTTTLTLDKDTFTRGLFGNDQPSDQEIKQYNLTKERATLYKNYYTYLYGLPMKLKDPGTIIDTNVERKTFKGKDYLVLKASYDKTTGSDVWFFYFDPETYAMEIYQFFKTDENGNLKTDSGEYILLSETTTINGIKMPKIRAWYYNKDDGYLGTDTLTN